VNRKEFENKLFIINKSRGPTSFDVVKAFRSATAVKKAGHAGTLDPLAEGVLIICTGHATKATGYFMDLPKTYEFRVHLGIATSTLDSEGEVTRSADCPDFSLNDIKDAANSFVGSQEQEPPMFSALKQNGKRLYELAREGKKAEIVKRMIRIYAFDILDLSLPFVDFRLDCSRGTYVRALARDIGNKLGMPAHVAKLVRTRIGPFDIEASFPDQLLFKELVNDLKGKDLSDALEFMPAMVVTEKASMGLIKGLIPRRKDIIKTIGAITPGYFVRVLDKDGRLMAIAHADEKNSGLDGYKLFNSTGKGGGL